MNDINELNKLKTERASLDEKIQKLEKIVNDPMRKLAEQLHSAFCRSEHTEHCSWFYEEWENVGKSDKREKYRWYQKAMDISTLALQHNIPVPLYLEMVQEWMEIVR